VSTVIVIAKAPVPGRAKTRLCPPCTPQEAATLAEAALADTLTAVAACCAERRVLALEGEPGDWLPAGFEVIPQRGNGLAERLAAAFADAGGRSFLVGMDTPQLTPDLLDAGLGEPCALGQAVDGGWWGLALPAPDERVFADIPMSTLRTGARQRSRLLDLGYSPARLPVLRDVDTIADAHAVAALAPATHFAAALGALLLQDVA
jgi:glycosyltransferase A (GT-A) superfamily protein (DUF2064 family)